ncbi:Qat anti-phage system TatD family nuclease QatD [Chryseobacterium sp. JV558]|uniref:Qat anti-phage system TatD family nuclease QatD n=1 Tax=Chryseobacterium sp. JV558 TaxID=2663236 RepID=UPI00299E7402|nr:Qat anti-phage system TatD family nuclease QatD [Chryseobacterium sp. JV558]MDW9382375.1 TatD family deoxyribonuclease [Chryseobacterium sp. JV558]
MIIDTHCHIDLYQAPEKVLQECIDADMIAISMTNLPSHFEMGYPHFRNLKKIRIALGMHPLYAKFHKKEFGLFLKNVSKTSYIGEVGLDFSKEGYATKNIQIESFTKILENVSGKNKILSIHSRGAEKEVLELLKKYNITSAIFHWYSGPINFIDEIINGGYYFSINPSMTKSEKGRKIIEKIPINCILTETDGPFTNISGNILKPVDVINVNKYFSTSWGKPINEVEKIITLNFRELIKSIK